MTVFSSPFTSNVGTIDEGASYRLRATLIATDSPPVPPLDALTMTWYDRATQTVINGWDEKSVLNENGGSYRQGSFEWELMPADTVIVSPDVAQEIHVALLSWTWDEGRRKGRHEISVTVRNLLFV